MEYEERVLKYKDRIVFGRLSTPYFDRIPKEYSENEACFVFVNKGEFSVRSQEDYMNLNKSQAILAKCLNYFLETNDKQKKCGDGVEVIGILLYPSLVKELLEFDISTSNYSFDYNIKQIEVDRALDNFRESINILLDNPELADDNMVKTKLKEFILLVSKSQEAPSQLDFLAALFKPHEDATLWMSSKAPRHPNIRFITRSLGGTSGTAVIDDLPPFMRFMYKYIAMPVLMPLMGMAHSLGTGAKRFVDGIGDTSLRSGVFYGSKLKVLTGPLLSIKVAFSRI